MTTRAREVEKRLREMSKQRERIANNMRGDPENCYDESAILEEAAALIAECETAKAELAEAVKLLRSCSNDLETQITIYYSPFQPDKYPHNARKMALEMMPVVEARVFIAKHAPTPELITGEVGEEKGETK